MPVARVNGIQIYYEEYGKGYPVVFLHAFGGTTHMWKPQIPALSERFRFIIYDARGHGRSESPPSADEYSPEIVVEDLYQLLGRLNISKAVLGGLSLGGLECLRFVIRHPDIAAALILMSSGPGYRDAVHMEEWNRKQEERAKLIEAEGMAGLVRGPGVGNMRSFMPQKLLLKHNPVGLANMARKVMSQHDTVVIEALGELKLPTLVIAGENDKPYLPASQYMARAVPGARLVVVPGAGHAVNIDNTEFFNREVLAFLDGLKLG